MAHHDRGGAIAEEYRAVRTSLLAQNPDERFCYLITSANAAEGKTITAANLAVVMAERIDRRTILVDCDLRKHMLANYLDASNTPGMVDMLRAQATLKQSVQPTLYPNLFFLPAGEIVEDEVAELIGRPELEEIVASQAAELKTSQEELQRSERMATLGTLVSGLGHDLNNLLLPIRGHLQALESSALDDSTRMHVQAVGQAVDYLQQLNDNLRLSALDPEGPSDARGVTDIGTWWDRLRGMLARAITAPVRLRVDLPSDLPAVGVAPHRLTQAVLNLLINASEAITGAGTVRLWAENSDGRQYVRIGVTDNGRGMTGEVQHRAFDPFFTTKQRRRATGLGLSLVHGIVHSAGGTVEIDSAPRRGTTIVLNLPVAPTDAVTRETAGRDEPASAAVSLRDRRIAACFKALLASAGFAVQPAPTRGLVRVDLWVTEPSPSSLRAARKLRAADPNCRIVVFGRASDDWLALGALTVEREGGLSTMREALAHAISAKRKEQ